MDGQNESRSDSSSSTTRRKRRVAKLHGKRKSTRPSNYKNISQETISDSDDIVEEVNNAAEVVSENEVFEDSDMSITEWISKDKHDGWRREIPLTKSLSWIKDINSIQDSNRVVDYPADPVDPISMAEDKPDLCSPSDVVMCCVFYYYANI